MGTTNSKTNKNRKTTKQRKTKQRKTKQRAPKADVYAEVTARIVAALERGVRPWHQPWSVEHRRPRGYEAQPAPS